MPGVLKDIVSQVRRHCTSLLQTEKRSIADSLHPGAGIQTWPKSIEPKNSQKSNSMDGLFHDALCS